MPRRCTVCDHPACASIDRALATDSLSCSAAGRRYQLDRTSVWRHRRLHLPLQLVQAQAAKDTLTAEALYADVEDQRRLVRVAIGQVLRKGDLMTSQDRRFLLTAVDRHLAAISLLAKIAGLAGADVAVSVTVTSDPAWVRLRDDLLDALADHPEAMKSVLRVLEGAA